MNTLRITLTEELEQILNLLQIRYPALSKVEITKLALGEMQKQEIEQSAPKSLSAFFDSLPRNDELSDEEAMEIAIEAINETRGK
jgi:hypothetical protein